MLFASLCCLPFAEAADIWSLGVLAFHLLTGETPFAHLSDDELRIYKRIARGHPRFPPQHDLSYEARDFIEKLLIRDPYKRLGAVSMGWLEYRV